MLNPGRKINKILLAAALAAVLLLMSCGFLQEQEEGRAAAEEGQDPGLYLFDYKDISIDTTSSIGTRIKNCNIYLDLYGDLIVMGELQNTSDTIKTDIEITLDFIGGNGPVKSETVPLKAEYLSEGAKCPFSYYFTDREKYIELSSVRIGVNYRDHNDSFEGNPIVQAEEYSYQGDYLIIEGSIVNIGGGKIKDLLLLCTFYDSRDRVVFIKECHLSRERMMPDEAQDFRLQVLMDDYIKEFARFSFEVFFADEIRVNV